MKKIYIYETTWLQLSETVFNRLVKASIIPSPYYMTLHFPPGYNECMKYKHQRSQLGTEGSEGLSCSMTILATLAQK